MGWLRDEVIEARFAPGRIQQQQKGTAILDWAIQMRKRQPSRLAFYLVFASGDFVYRLPRKP